MPNKCIILKPYIFNALKEFLNIEMNINKINYLGYIFIKEEIIYNVK